MEIKRKDLKKIGNARVRLGQWISTKTIYKSVNEERYFIHRPANNDYLEVVYSDGVYTKL